MNVSDVLPSKCINFQKLDSLYWLHLHAILSSLLNYAAKKCLKYGPVFLLCFCFVSAVPVLYNDQLRMLPDPLLNLKALND